MRRILLVLTVAALMAAMMVTAGPAKADVSFGGGSSVDVDVDVGDGFGFDDVGDGIRRFDVGDGFFGFDVGDGDDDEDGINSSFFFSQVNSEAGDIRPGGVSFS
jgi:hypothetical protein